MAIQIRALVQHATECACKGAKGWVPVRPENWKPAYYSFWSRLKDACGVLMGRYNAIYWEDK